MKRKKTPVTKASDIKREWHLVDLDNQVLGRVATGISQLLVGKNKPYYTAHLDCGDFVVAVNAGKVAFTGKKLDRKLYRWHTGFPGGFRERSLQEMMRKDPRRVVELAVKRMLPKNKLRQSRLGRLKVYEGAKHPYEDRLKIANS